MRAILVRCRMDEPSTTPRVVTVDEDGTIRGDEGMSGRLREALRDWAQGRRQEPYGYGCTWREVSR